MTFSQADSGHINPYYHPQNYAYSHNCQSCVVTYEARIRGYDVQVAPKQHTGKTEQLARHSSWAWLDAKTNKKCEYSRIPVNNGLDCYKWMDKTIKQGERYQFAYNWEIEHKGRTFSGAHVVCLSRDDNGKLRYYDPQINKTLTEKQLLSRLNRLIVYKKTQRPRILRVDDKKFNPYFINDVTRKK